VGPSEQMTDGTREEGCHNGMGDLGLAIVEAGLMTLDYCAAIRVESEKQQLGLESEWCQVWCESRGLGQLLWECVECMVTHVRPGLLLWARSMRSELVLRVL
jgi:hypothetical protein